MSCFSIRWTPPLTALELTENDSHVSRGLGRASIPKLQNGLDVPEEGRVIACNNVEDGDGKGDVFADIQMFHG